MHAHRDIVLVSGILQMHAVRVTCCVRSLQRTDACSTAINALWKHVCSDTSFALHKVQCFARCMQLALLSSISLLYTLRTSNQLYFGSGVTAVGRSHQMAHLSLVAPRRLSQSPADALHDDHLEDTHYPSAADAKCCCRARCYVSRSSLCYRAAVSARLHAHD